MNPLEIGTIPRLYTALAEWMACVVYILQFRHRLRGAKLVGVMLLFLLVQGAFLHFTGDVPLGWWIPCMLAAIGLMFAFIATCCDIPLLDAGYTCVRAFVLAEFVASLQWQLVYYGEVMGASETDPIKIMMALIVLMLLTYLVLFGLMYYIEKRSQMKDILNVRWQEFWLAAMIGASVFLMSNLSFISSSALFTASSDMEIYNIRTLVDLGGLAILYAYHLQRSRLRLKQELDSIDMVLHNQYVQYQQSRESIEIINHKYHDLKHQIAALRAEPDAERRNVWLDEMESDIKSYEAQNKTGNQVLDTLLTGKSLYCQKHDINLTCVADGALLDFMDTMDVCTIFGNAMDNAIESVRRISDPDRRLIHVTVAQQKGFVLMRFENCYEGELQFDDGLPVTTKADKAYHGFGLKSIRQTVPKYGGTVTVEASNKWFELKVLLPLHIP